MTTTTLIRPLSHPMTTLRRWTRDARHFQIAYLGIFLLYGIFALGWQAEIGAYLTLIGTSLAVQAFWISRTTRDYRGLKSAMITALGLCLLCKANSWGTLALAATIAISSKFLIRFNGKHLFNPANIGLIAAILLTGDAWVSPGQWGSDVLLFFMMGAAACIVLLKVGRMDTSLAFLFTFAGLLFIEQVIYKGWPLDHWWHSLSSGTLLLFTFFMITDPVTTPNASRARIIWACLVGLLTYGMTTWFYVFDAPIWALIIVTPTTVVLDRYFKHQRFSWYS